jgi:hypothetical protein
MPDTPDPAMARLARERERVEFKEHAETESGE